MPRYAVLLHATGLRQLNQEGKPAAAGVYTWKIVDAGSPAEAERIASTKLREDTAFMEELWNTEHEPIEIAVEEISEPDDRYLDDSGFVYYFDEEDDYPYGFES